MNTTKAYAIVIGSGLLSADKYGGCEVATQSAENDAAAMGELAMNRGFNLIGPGGKSAPFLSRDAVKDDIKAAVSKAAKELKRGDTLLLFYSGHGASLPTGHKPPFERQETWCLVDGRLWDFEWDHLRAEFRYGVRLVIVSDSCYSGGFGPPEEDDPRDFDRVRCAKPRLLGKDCMRTLAGNSAVEFERLHKELRAEHGDEKPRQRARVLLLAACQANQLACADEEHGYFTRRLLKVAKEQPNITYAALFHDVRRGPFERQSFQSPFWWLAGRGADAFRYEQAFQP